MAHYYVTRAKEQAAAGGTGAFTLGGATAGDYVAFNSKLTVNGDTAGYLAINAANAEWEEGILTRTSATTYTRTVLNGTNGTSAVNFTAAPIVFSNISGAELLPLGGPAFRAYLAADQSVGSAAYTKATLANTSYNYGGHFDTVNNRFVAPLAGLYEFKWTVYGSAASATDVHGRLRKNAGTILSYGSYANSGTTGISVGSDEVQLAAADYIELDGYVGSGTAKFHGDAAANETFLTGRLVRIT